MENEFQYNKCSVMHIGHNKHAKQLYHVQSTVADNRSTAGSRNHQHQIPQVAKTNREKLQNCQQSTGVHCQQCQVQKQRTDLPIIQIPRPPTSRTFSAVQVPKFKVRH